MAYQRDPSDLDRTDELRRAQMLDNEMQADPELAEGPASGGRMALFAIAIIAILGVVFYGLNNSPSTNTAQTPPAAISTPAQQNAQTNTMSPNNSTINPNANPGQTTGAAPAAPQTGNDAGK